MIEGHRSNVDVATMLVMRRKFDGFAARVGAGFVRPLVPPQIAPSFSFFFSSLGNLGAVFHKSPLGACLRGA